ncbi:MAG: hypothetical protein GQ579_01500 [Bacteroidales bacterium]|nr:hypothetical protein [Bacteroidales bacterium]
MYISFFIHLETVSRICKGSFIDTAGIRETADTIENLGIRRTYQKIEQASVVLLLTVAGDDPELSMRSVEALLAQDIREVLHYLGEITGEVTTDEVLGNIFKNFCIGK